MSPGRLVALVVLASVVVAGCGGDGKRFATTDADGDGKPGVRVRGVYTSSPEISEFQLCGTSKRWVLVPPADSVESSAYLQVMGDYARVRFDELSRGVHVPAAPPGVDVLYLVVRADTVAPGIGQSGQPGEVRVHEVIEISSTFPRDCEPDSIAP